MNTNEDLIIQPEQLRTQEQSSPRGDNFAEQQQKEFQQQQSSPDASIKSTEPANCHLTESNENLTTEPANASSSAEAPIVSPALESDSGAVLCIRQGCSNPAITNPEWEDEYCSNECVVSHCRNVFSSWKSNQNGGIISVK